MEKNVTKKQIAEYLGISRTTVSLVLNNVKSARISEDTRKKVLEAARLLGYREINPVRSKSACFILYNRTADDPRYMMLLECIEKVAGENGYNLVFMSLRKEQEDLYRLRRFLQTKETDFVIISGEIDDIVIDLLEKSGVMFFVYGPTNNLNINSFMIDPEKIAYEGVKSLIKRGHKRIAFFAGSLDFLIHKMNYNGYKRALKESNIPFDASLVQTSTKQDGAELVNKCDYLGIDYSAIFCVNTLLQFGSLIRLKEKGINVPLNVSLMGIGYSNLVRISDPQLSTIIEDHSEAIKILFKKIISKIDDPSCVQKVERIILDVNPKFYEGGTIADINV